MSEYRFPGITKFMAAAGLGPAALVKAPGVWWIARAVDAISQIPHVPPEHRPDMLEVALTRRNEMAAALTGLDAAIEEVRHHCCRSQPPTKPSSPTTRSSAPASSS